MQRIIPCCALAIFFFGTAVDAAVLPSSGATVAGRLLFSYTTMDNAVFYNGQPGAWYSKQHGYNPVSNEDGLIYTASAPGLVPLTRYFRNCTTKTNAKECDTLMAASVATTDWAKANGYANQGIEGYVLASNTSDKLCAPPSVCDPLENWFSSSRNDHILCGSRSSRNAAMQAGYKFLRVEGYQAPQANPGPMPPYDPPRPPAPAPPSGWARWADWAPNSMPVGKSEAITAWEWDQGDYASYGGADTWYPTWARDGTLFTPFTDGCVVDMHTNQRVCAASYRTGNSSTTGYATVHGTDPHNLTITDVKLFTSSTLPYQGRYPCGSLYHKGVWYYGTYYLDNPTFPPNPEPNCGNWCVQGPFSGFRTSTDRGATWHEPRLYATSATDNVFGETAMNNSKVKFGAPHVVDFGPELEHSPDGKMYIVGHGAQRPEAHQSWMQGDQVYMARVTPGVDTVNDKKNWEFFAGRTSPGGADQWVKGDVAAAKPIFEWENHTGVVTMTYLPPIKRYVMTISTPTFEPYTTKQFDTYFLESTSITGPWKYITYMYEFGPEAYFVHVFSRFLSNQTSTANGTKVLEGYLSYSANFAFRHGADPVGSGYHWSLQRMRFVLGDV